MFRAPNINRTVAVTGELRGGDEAGGDGGGKKFTIPDAEIVIGDVGRNRTLQNFPYAYFHRLKSLPVAAGSESVTLNV